MNEQRILIIVGWAEVRQQRSPQEGAAGTFTSPFCPANVRGIWRALNVHSTEELYTTGLPPSPLLHEGARGDTTDET